MNKDTGEVLGYLLQNTSELNTLEMAELYESVWKFTSTYLNYTIPSPGVQAEIFLNQ